MGEPKPSKDFEKEIEYIKAELQREKNEAGLAKLTLVIRGLISLVLVALAGFLYYLGGVSLVSPDSRSDVIVVATTNAGTFILTAVGSYWLNYRGPE